MRCTGENRQSGFSLLEIIIVISLIAIVYSVALPNLGVQATTEASTKLAMVASDIRGAFDMAVLNRKPFRLVFMMTTGEYWLETTDRTDFYLGDEGLDRDLTETEEKESIEYFDEEFERYVELAGSEIADSDNDRVIAPTSPLLAARDRLKPVKWTMVETSEWYKRSIGPTFLFQDMQAEHHKSKQTFDVLGEEGRAILYFFPNGYVERAFMHVGVRKNEMEVDDTQPPYTITTNPFTGTANVVSGYEDVNLEEYDEF
ncbi:MAG: prepilin-type N-terminal cleavage/methylation domain-containing protein [Oligoflexales bacterium]